MGSGSIVTVFCTACRSEAQVRSRAEYSSFHETHRRTCGTLSVLYGATLDELLDLPPYWVPTARFAVALTERQPGVQVDHAID
jgi:hypothetical protein